MSKDKVQKDFEMTMLFHAGEILGIKSLAGILQKDPATGLYKNQTVQVAYATYAMAMSQKNDALERCNPDRYISAGMVTQFRQLVGKQASTEEMIAAALKVANSTPI